jgi:signal peptidase II
MQEHNMNRSLLLLVALCVLLMDQMSKYYLVHVVHMPNASPIEVTSFFNLVMVWNYGVSFGMFSQLNAKWGLIAVSLGISALLWHMSKDAYSKLHLSAYGMVVGGALGNMVDRLNYGAVADFFDFHLAGWHYPAFNVADMAIVCGVIALLACELLLKNRGDRGN